MGMRILFSAKLMYQILALMPVHCAAIPRMHGEQKAPAPGDQMGTGDCGIDAISSQQKVSRVLPCYHPPGSTQNTGSSYSREVMQLSQLQESTWKVQRTWCSPGTGS